MHLENKALFVTWPSVRKSQPAHTTTERKVQVARSFHLASCMCHPAHSAEDNMRLRSTWIDVLQISQNIIMYGSQDAGVEAPFN